MNNLEGYTKIHEENNKILIRSTYSVLVEKRKQTKSSPCSDIFLLFIIVAQYADTTPSHTTRKTNEVTMPMVTESTPAVENEPQFAPLAESEVQPEGETNPESEVQPEGETNPESESQNETSPESETAPEPEVEAEVRPSDAEIVLPPVTLIAVISIGINLFF